MLQRPGQVVPRDALLHAAPHVVPKGTRRDAGSPGAALATGGSAGGCLVRGPPRSLSRRLVPGVLADHHQNGLGIRMVQSRYRLEDLIRLLEPADLLEIPEVER